VTRDEQRIAHAVIDAASRRAPYQPTTAERERAARAYATVEALRDEPPPPPVRA
jgi:hypothetical protein